MKVRPSMIGMLTSLMIIATRVPVPDRVLSWFSPSCPSLAWRTS
jgi:hypothetical protein